MFDLLKNWITSIVVVVVFMSLVDIILPSNSLKKYARLVLGLIIIIIIITPIFSLFSKGTNIDAKINDYMKQYDNINNSSSKSAKSYINTDTITIFKQNLVDKIEETIYTESGKKYKVIDIALIEDEQSKKFLNTKSITLKNYSSTSSVKKVAKIDLNKKEDDTDYFWDKEVAYILKDKFSIDTSVIRFVR